MIVVLQQMPTVSLGPTGTIIITIVAAILGFITWRQRTWRSTADAAVAEMNVHKSSAERLQTANSDLVTKVAKLEAQTDLKPLVDAIASWVTEGRERFNDAKARLEIIHSEQSSALKSLLEEIRAQRTTSEDAYRSLAASFIAHTLDDKQYQLRFVNMMDSVERRLSDVAVQVGVSKWSEPPAFPPGK